MHVVAEVFDCEIQARYRDLNYGAHVDNGEVVRVVDEARIQFLGVYPIEGIGQGWRGQVPQGVADLLGALRIEYRSVLPAIGHRPYLVRAWVGHIGRTSFTISYEIRIDPDGEPAAVAETVVAIRDASTGAPAALDDAARAVLESYLAEPVALRPR